MAVRFPSVARRGLGVGMDMPWTGTPGAVGFGPGDHLSQATRRFLSSSAAEWSHAFFSWQARDRAPPRLVDYSAAWDDLAAALPDGLPRALHHTALDLAALGPCARDELLAFTNALCERYHLGWVNEDVGFWSLAGRPLPYPLPPLLTDEGLAAAVENVRECQRSLIVPLVLEFPGFDRGASVVLGEIDAYDFFRRLAEHTGAPVTLDVGHLLSWRWWRGLRGDALYHDLDRLPLDHCFEVHLSGCSIAGDHFIDAHHGDLLDEQLELLARLLPRCTNLRAVTFEDPRLDGDGQLLPASARSWQRLQEVTRSWISSVDGHGSPSAPDPGVSAIGFVDRPNGARLEAALAALLYDAHARAGLGETTIDHHFRRLDRAQLDEAARGVLRLVRERVHRGVGAIAEWYPRTLAAWRAAHPHDADLEELATRFCASPHCASWRELDALAPGISIEEALYRFFDEHDVGDAATREDEFLGTVVRALAVTPDARFVWPSALRRAPGGCFAVTRALVLHAAVEGRYLRGPLTPLVAAILEGAATSTPPPDVARVREELRRMRLVA
jgi:uncharacterized protein (UPF0276 family)